MKLFVLPNASLAAPVNRTLAITIFAMPVSRGLSLITSANANFHLMYLLFGSTVGEGFHLLLERACCFGPGVNAQVYQNILVTGGHVFTRQTDLNGMGGGLLCCSRRASIIPLFVVLTVGEDIGNCLF